MLGLWLTLVGAVLADEPDVPGDPVPAEAAPAEKEPSWKRKGFGFGGIPAVNYNTDEGLGLGAVASVYRYDGKTSPYKVGVTLIIFATTKGIQGHRLDVDALKLLNGRLRFTGRANLDVTRTNNFCGFGPDVTCDPAVAEQAADDAGLVGEERETFVRRYYLSSYIRPNLFLNGRWKLNSPDSTGRLKTELMTTVRAIYHKPGDFKAVDSDPGNLISTRLDLEQGFLPVLQVGLMADTRDFESAPSSGYWVEGSVRGSTRYIGSDFDYFGFNTTARGYVPIVSEGRLVSATRLAIDGIVGDVPIREMAQMGGSQLYNVGGGLNSSRGVRQRRFLGNVKTLLQEEIRWRFVHFEPFHVPVDLTWLAFGDLMLVAEDWSTLDDLSKPIPSFGTGLRLAFDDNFIIRVDAGFSPVEDYSPGIYIDLGNLF
ncbi:MAG: BamA/TamA family outer membrane protein [Alphaproteobacteria bacterium]|nr:BamA/TamA family outer membrane protein [Alphaproteobacteria bacterium]